MAAVGNSVFASYPVTHEIVLRGYQNGQTQVYDPYNANNNGWYSVDYIFGSKSGAPEDNTEGSPFISVRAQIAAGHKAIYMGLSHILVN